MLRKKLPFIEKYIERSKFFPQLISTVSNFVTQLKTFIILFLNSENNAELKRMKKIENIVNYNM